MTKAIITKVHETKEVDTAKGGILYKFRITLDNGDNGRTGLKKTVTSYKEGQELEYSREVVKGYKTIIEEKKPFVGGGSPRDYKTEAVFVAFQCATQCMVAIMSQGENKEVNVKEIALEILSSIDEVIGARK